MPVERGVEPAVHIVGTVRGPEAVYIANELAAGAEHGILFVAQPRSSGQGGGRRSLSRLCRRGWASADTLDAGRQPAQPTLPLLRLPLLLCGGEERG